MLTPQSLTKACLKPLKQKNSIARRKNSGILSPWRNYAMIIDF